MGYYSSVVIGVDKETYAGSILLLRNLPKLLIETPGVNIRNGMFWRLGNIKWYDDIPDVKEVLEYFDLLLILEETARQKEKLKPVKEREQIYLYGAIRIGEDNNDIESWGDPDEFGIYFEKTITAPI